MIKAFKENWKNMFTISGREDRGTFWWYAFDFALFWVLFFPLAMFSWDFVWRSSFATNIYYIVFCIVLAFASPLTVALFTGAARRMHDANVTAWWEFLLLIPFIGLVIVVLVLAVGKEDQDNKYNEMKDFKWWQTWWTWVVLILMWFVVIYAVMNAFVLLAVLAFSYSRVTR